MTRIEQADKIKELVALIRKADEELSDFAWFRQALQIKVLKNLKLKLIML